MAREGRGGRAHMSMLVMLGTRGKALFHFVFLIVGEMITKKYV
jgi:hypothetical protein